MLGSGSLVLGPSLSFSVLSPCPRQPREHVHAGSTWRCAAQQARHFTMNPSSSAMPSPLFTPSTIDTDTLTERHAAHDDPQTLPPPASETDAASNPGEDDGTALAASFDAMALCDPLLRGVFRMGFETPSEVQRRGIPAICTGRDCLIQGRSGSGKTATFAMGCLQQLDPECSAPQVLVLSPTRELAFQTSSVFRELAAHMPTVGVHSPVGGTSVRAEERLLAAGGLQIICGTPGRIGHLLRTGALATHAMRTVVLDEADVLLDCGFSDAVYTIFTGLPRGIQAVLASATMPPALLAMSRKVLQNELAIRLPETEINVASIRQFFVDCGSEADKLGVLLDLYGCISVAQTIIFVNRRDRAERLADELDHNDFTVSILHGEMEQSQRTATLDAFRMGTTRILVATDLIGRGIDVQQVSLVINFDLPPMPEDYMHRVGRSGRYGRRGVAISLLTDRDARHKADLERRFRIEISALPKDVASILS